MRWKKVYVERLPIPKITVLKQQPFRYLVDRILNAKAGDQQSSVAAAEAEIDDLVYQSYGLAAEEVAMVEGSNSSYRDA